MNTIQKAIIAAVFISILTITSFCFSTIVHASNTIPKDLFKPTMFSIGVFKSDNIYIKKTIDKKISGDYINGNYIGVINTREGIFISNIKIGENRVLEMKFIDIPSDIDITKLKIDSQYIIEQQTLEFSDLNRYDNTRYLSELVNASLLKAKK